MAISLEKRQTVWQRAGGCCEYCLLSLHDMTAEFHVDHIIAKKYDGNDDTDNLCLACAECNRHKGAVVAALDTFTDQPTRLFNPRSQRWNDHFTFQNDGFIFGVTPEGRVTAMVLRFNLSLRTQMRQVLYKMEKYPCQ